MSMIQEIQLRLLNWLLKRKSLSPHLEMRVANALEHDPELTDCLVGERVLAYRHLRDLKRILDLFEINLVIRHLS